MLLPVVNISGSLRRVGPGPVLLSSGHGRWNQTFIMHSRERKKTLKIQQAATESLKALRVEGMCVCVREDFSFCPCPYMCVSAWTGGSEKREEGV